MKKGNILLVMIILFSNAISAQDCTTGIVTNPNLDVTLKPPPLPGEPDPETLYILPGWTSTSGTPTLNSTNSVTMVYLNDDPLNNNNWIETTEAIFQPISGLIDGNLYYLELTYLFGDDSELSEEPAIGVWLGSNYTDNGGFDDVGPQGPLPDVSGAQQLIGFNNVDNSSGNSGPVSYEGLYTIPAAPAVYRTIYTAFIYDGSSGNNELVIFPYSGLGVGVDERKFTIAITDINIYCVEMQITGTCNSDDGFDASLSLLPPELSYAPTTWNFGDGSTFGTGVSINHTYTYGGLYQATASIDGYTLDATIQNTCCDTCNSFKPQERGRYWISAWVQVGVGGQVKTYSDGLVGPSLELEFQGSSSSSVSFYPTGEIIDGWQRIVGEFSMPIGTAELSVILNADPTFDTYFDDIRIHPFNASMKSYVYDGETFWLVSELDDNNYATFYEYDEEGGLIRIKKETERGIVTIQETRSSTVKQ